MSTPLRSLAVTALVTTAIALVLPAATASAAPAKTSATKTSTVGYDVSYPQCGSSLPSGAAFGVVGVNGGLATKPNGCLATELGWAWGSSGSTAQPKAQLYVNTADPGQVRDQVTDWPTSGSTPYGDCTVGVDGYGLDDQACAWEYGSQRAQNDVDTIFTPAATR